MIEQDYMSEKWFALLKAKIAEKTAQVVAAELDYSKTALSLIVNGKYVGKTDRIKVAVLATYQVVDCPYHNKLIERKECVALATAAAPTHNPLKMQQWRACQRCPNKPNLEKNHELD